MINIGIHIKQRPRGSICTRERCVGVVVAATAPGAAHEHEQRIPSTRLHGTNHTAKWRRAGGVALDSGSVAD